MIWDPIRACFVKSSPEELVRQKWILAMIGPLGYPKGLIAVEKDLASISQGENHFDPNRRIDLLCFMRSVSGLKPLLLIECKEAKNNEPAQKQVLGYQFYVQAPFFCVIRGDSATTYWMEQGSLRSIPFLPTYADLLAKL